MANRIEIIIDSVTDGLESGLKKTEHGLGRFKYAALGAGVAVAGGLAVGLEKSVHAAIEAQQAEARLTQAYKNAHVAIGPLRAQINGLEASGRKLGFTDEETTTSLGSLITATRNQKMAVKDLSVAQDLARFKGVGLSDATKMLTMAMTGSQRAAKQLGITVQPVTTTYDALKATMGKTIDATEKLRLAHAKLEDKQLTGIAVVDAVSAHVKGQGEAFAGTAAGGMAQFHAQIQHIEVEIGNKLLPVITSAISYVMAHWPQISKAVEDSWNQIKPVLVALEQLIVSVVSTIRSHWSTIGPIVHNVTQVIKDELAVVAGIIKFFAAVLRGDWSGAWNALKGVVANAMDAVKSELRAAAGIVEAIARGIGSALVNGIVSGLSFLGGRIVALIKSAVNHVIDEINSALSFHVSINTHIPGIGTKSFGYDSHIPHLAKGADSFAGGMATVGERGPETLLIPRGSSVIPHGYSGAGGGGSPIVVNLMLDGIGKPLAKILIDPLRGEAKLVQQATGKPAFG